MDNLTNYLSSRPTPLIPLPTIAKSHSLDCDCTLYGKCEFLSPGGSVRSRKSFRLIDTIKKQTTDPENSVTSPTIIHSLGIAGTVAAAGNSYPSVCVGNEVKTEHYSRLFTGYKGFLFETESDSVACIAQTKKHLQSLIPSSVVDDEVQLDDVSQPSLLAEIKAQLPTIGAIVCTEISLEELGSSEDLQDTHLIVATTKPVDPTLASEYSQAKWYQVSPEDALEKTKELISSEGLLCSTRSGAVLSAALTAIEELNLYKANVILMLEEAYILSPQFPKPTKTASANPLDDWWKEQVVGDLPLQPAPILDPKTSIQKALESMDSLNMERAVVQDTGTGQIFGAVSVSHLQGKLLNNKLTLEDTLEANEVIFRRFEKVGFDAKLGDVMGNELKHCFACVVVQRVAELEQGNGNLSLMDSQSCQEDCRKIYSDVVVAIVTAFDIMQYIAGVEEHHIGKTPSWMP